ncbi:MAG: desulfoferrodoxin [Victivallales bacterium]|jgi:superoxide reductase|nr:desulfoferrodoxin [Victivallales bacterium]
MSKKSEVYRCELCGAMVEVIDGGAGQLVCCDEPMALLDEKTADAATEKHVPVIEKVEGGVKVTVGSVPHPMADDHYIQWIEIVACGKTIRQELKPGMAPEACFCLCCCDDTPITAREYCNKHGLWKA